MTALRRVYATAVENNRLTVMGSYDDMERCTLFSQWPKVTYVKQIFDYRSGTLLSQTKIKSKDVRKGSYLEIGRPRIFKNTVRRTNAFKSEARRMLQDSAARVCSQFPQIILHKNSLEELTKKLPRRLEVIPTESGHIEATRLMPTEHDICVEYAFCEDKKYSRKSVYYGPLVNLSQEDAMRFHAWRLGADAVAEYNPELGTGIPVKFADKKK